MKTPQMPKNTIEHEKYRDKRTILLGVATTHNCVGKKRQYRILHVKYLIGKEFAKILKEHERKNV